MPRPRQVLLLPAPAHPRTRRPARRSAALGSARRKQGLSLIESAALISLTGILVAAFAPTFLRHLRMSKIAEAVDTLDSLYRGTAAYYSREHTLAEGKLARGCLPPSAGPFPGKPQRRSRSSSITKLPRSTRPGARSA